MFGSFPIGSVLGIPVRVHGLLVVLVVVLLIVGESSGGLFALQLLMLFGALFLHELGHSLVARRFGVHVIDITLWPLGGLARLSHVPEKSGPEIVIAIAGPLVNFALAGLALPLWLWVRGLPEASASVVYLIEWFLGVNVLMGAFNLIPAFPMDGGRILRAWLARGRDWSRATVLAVSVGRVFAAMMGALGALVLAAGLSGVEGLIGTGLMWLFLAAWLWRMGALEIAAVSARHAAADVHVARTAAGPVDPAQAFAEFLRAAAVEDPRRAEVRSTAKGGFSDEDIARLEKVRGRLNGVDHR